MRLSGTKATAIHQYRGLGNQLWDLAGNRPSLDLRFAESKSLVDATTGTNLIDFTRASSGTYVGSDGLIKTATTNYLLQSEDFSTTWGTARLRAFGSGSTVNATTAPNGTLTADFIQQASGQTNAGVVFISAGIPTPTASIYAKASTKSKISILTDVGGNSETWFDLASGTVGTVGSNHTASIVNVGNGWYRCIVSASVTSTNFSIYLADTDGSRTVIDSGGVFLWGAQLEQSSTVGEYIKTTSTINSAPRFDHDPVTGECLGLLVEESRTNLMVRSEEFDNAAWNSAAGARTVTANQVVAPDGLLTADTVTADGTTAPHFVSQSVTLSATPYAYSVFAKAGTNDFLQLRTFSAFGGMWANFNLAAGVVGTVGTVSGATPTSSIQAYPNGWYRCTMVFTPAATTSSVGAYIVSSASAPGSQANSLSTTVHLWGAQLE